MSEHLAGGWYPPGVVPESGHRYEFEDFVGARFVGTFDRLEENVRLDPPDDHGPVLLLHFTDRPGFATNFPVRFRDA